MLSKKAVRAKSLLKNGDGNFFGSKNTSKVITKTSSTPPNMGKAKTQLKVLIGSTAVQLNDKPRCLKYIDKSLDEAYNEGYSEALHQTIETSIGKHMLSMKTSLNRIEELKNQLIILNQSGSASYQPI